MTLPKIGITLGDPAGIGPEIVLKSLTSRKLFSDAQYIIFGSPSLVEEEEKTLGIRLNIQLYREDYFPDSAGVFLYEVPCLNLPIEKGVAKKETGQASFQFFSEGVKAAQEKVIHSLVTGPVSKKSWGLAGLPWRGHTQYLSHIYPQAIMVFWSEKIKVALFSAHLPLKSAVERVKKEKLIDFFLQLHQSLEKIQPQKFRIIVAGLNPHAGEDGLLGTEEIDEIKPAVQEAKKAGMNISGPYPPDVVFRTCLNQPDTVVVALYHDQGCIPFKLESFDLGVNITLGLPFIRTSPDHGTAFDIAGKGKAVPLSMIEAIKLAAAFTKVEKQD